MGEIIEESAIPEEFRPYLNRERWPEPDAQPEQPNDDVVTIHVTFDKRTQNIDVRLPDGWGVGDWYRMLLAMTSQYGYQLVDAAIAMEAREKAGMGNGRNGT